jgi:hypothetical protein
MRWDSCGTRTTIPASAWGPVDAAGFRYLTAAIKTSHSAYPHWTSPVHVTVRLRNGQMDIVGIERPTGRESEGRKVNAN